MSAGTTARSVSRAEGVDRVRALQRVLYRCAKQQPERRFHALYDHIARSDVMWKAWVDVARNAGAPGVDGVTITQSAADGTEGVRAFLDALAAELRAKTYRPKPLRRVHIPMPGKPGATRPLGIPAVRDRVVMAAARIVLEPIFEADFSPASFGFRPKRSAHHALEVVRVEANRGAQWVLDADIAACFDEIDHDALLAQVARRVSDRDVLKLLRSWLRAGVFEGGVVTDVESGTPQGSPVSPLLANIALHVLDEAWAATRPRPGTLVRYADDLVVLCPTEARAVKARERVAPRPPGRRTRRAGRRRAGRLAGAGGAAPGRPRRPRPPTRGSQPRYGPLHGHGRRGRRRGTARTSSGMCGGWSMKTGLASEGEAKGMGSTRGRRRHGPPGPAKPRRGAKQGGL